MFWQAVLLSSTVLLSWLLMQAFHEAGHCLGAIATGGEIQYVDLHPLRISHTYVSPNPRPLIVIWGGPIIGTVIPVLLWSLASLMRITAKYLCRYFAGFCCVANGAYIGSGVFAPVGDARELQQLNVPGGWMLLFGISTIVLGMMFWNRLGPHFGLGPAPKRIDRIHTITAVILLTTVIALECLFAN